MGWKRMRYEDLMADAVIEYLQGVCIRYGWQIPALQGRIDFVGIRKSYEVIIIEAKVSKWQKALEQANKYQLCSDKAYVAVPEQVAERAIKNVEAFRRRGIGLMSVGKNLKILLGAQRTNLLIPEFRRYLIKITLNRRKNSENAVKNVLNRHMESFEQRPNFSSPMLRNNDSEYACENL